jgi:hypothetical protein
MYVASQNLRQILDESPPLFKVRCTPNTILKRNPALSKINVQQNAVNFICNQLTCPFIKNYF